MYIPLKYRNEDLSEVRDFLVRNSFAILVSIVDGKPWGTHIPLELEEDPGGGYCLVGHMARANPQWKGFSGEGEVLCIFNGPHSYISSSWYVEEEVPTWNYIAVHVYGKVHLLSEAEVLDSLGKLLAKYEKDSESPLSIQDFSKNTMRQIRGIVGFRIGITSIQAAYKLSQGRETDHPRIMEALRERSDEGAKAIARHIQKFSDKTS